MEITALRDLQINSASAGVRSSKRNWSSISVHLSFFSLKSLRYNHYRELAGEQLTLENSVSVKEAADNIKSKYSKLDILVNSAGFAIPISHHDLDALDDNLMDQMLIANVRGPFSVIRELRPLLKAAGDSVIVNLSSVSGFKGTGSSIAYVSCKAAIDTMSLALARVLGPEIRVNCVSPGAVATDFVEGRDRKKLEKISENSPLKKVVEPEDVAMAIMAYVTHLKHSTGARMVVDSGNFLK